MAFIGIDLGTSNSAAAVLRGGRPVIIPGAEGVSLGGKAFPSYVAIAPDGQMLVGEPARRQAAANPEGTATAFKRRMGRRETIRLRGREFTPEQLSAHLLQKIKRDAEAFLGEPVEKAVVTVPAYFDDNQRSATRDACRIAGLDVARLVNEPTAASLAYGLDRLGQELRIAVIDFGAEIAKIELSTSTTTHVGLPFLLVAAGEPRHLEADVSRATLEELVRPVLERCRHPVEQALPDAGVLANQIDRIIFVGGPTRMPIVRAFFEQVLGRKAEMGIDPMECVAQGAAIQAGVLGGQVGEILLVDVTPLTLGVETLGGVATPLIDRNSPIPTKKTEVFTTAADMQTSVTIRVFQGERPMAADNTALGTFNLDGLPPAPQGVPKIEVTFDIDESGILDVSAKDTATGRSQSIRITGSSRLPEADKQRMIREAERYAEEDRRRREAAEKLNAADAVAYQADRTVAQFADRIGDDLRGRIQSAVRDLREALGRRDAEQASQRADVLKRILQEVGAGLYGGVQPPPPSEAAPGGQPPSGREAGEEGRVMNAEYHEVEPHHP